MSSSDALDSDLLDHARKFAHTWATSRGLPEWIDRDDLAQETLLAWQDTSGRPQAYRNKAASNRMVDHLRRLNYTGKRRAGFSSPTDPASLNPCGSSDGLPSDILSKEQREAIQELPARWGEVLFLRHVEGLTQKETAARFGITASRVSQIEREAKLRLQGAANRRHGHDLSLTERDVLVAATTGESMRETALRLGRAEHTIISHRRHLMAKLGARNMAQAVHLGHQKGLL